jgi:hypothetical protein
MVMNVPVQVAPRSELPVPQLRMLPAGKGLVLESDVGGDLEGFCRCDVNTCLFSRLRRM